MKFLLPVMKLYLIIWTITPALGIYENCNNSLGLPDLDVNNIYIHGVRNRTFNKRGNIRLSENWEVFKVTLISATPIIIVDLGKVYNITGMIIKGKEGYGTNDLESFGVRYSNKSWFNMAYKEHVYYMTGYESEGKYQDFEGTTKEENIRYQQFNPFLARYFGISLVFYGNDFIYIQFDLLGCNITEDTSESTVLSSTEPTVATTVTPCNDILNTTLTVVHGPITMKCPNGYTLQIEFEETGVYQITMVNVTFVMPNHEYLSYPYTTLMIYADGLTKVITTKTFHKKENIQLAYKLKPPVQSINICIYSRNLRKARMLEDIYEYAITEVRGCYMGP